MPFQFFDTILMKKARQEEWYHFQPDRPMGTLRVDFQSFCHFLAKFVDVRLFHAPLLQFNVKKVLNLKPKGKFF